MLTLDLHPIFRSNRDVDIALRTFLVRAAARGESSVALIPGLGPATLRRRVLIFLDQPHVRKLHQGVELDPRNAGRIVVHLHARSSSAGVRKR